MFHSATRSLRPYRARVSEHARRRMQNRAISSAALSTVMDYGRIVHTRGAIVYAIGRREIERFEPEGVDLRTLDGVQVVCSLDGTVITAYRNRNFHGLRSNLGRGRRRARRG